MTPPTAPVKEGDILAGKYRVDKVLGVGGMGVVVAAHHLQLDEKVAIKFLLPHMTASSEAMARFAREARAAVKIKSEHVARVSDVGTLDTGAPYMVMEHLEGGDLSAWLEKRGRLPLEQAVEFTLQACEALAEAHALGIVHRDLKPANLFVIRRPDGQLSVKVLDFGISKAGQASDSGVDMSMTKTSAVMGSPLYMSPEQMQSSKNADPRADIWAMGVVLYELVTGKQPFQAESLPELITQIILTQPEPMRKIRPELPAQFEAVIARCLEKDREKRYRNVAEFGHALLPFGPRQSRNSVERISRVIDGAGLSASALALPPSSDFPGAAPASTAGAWGQTSPIPMNRVPPWVWVAAAIGVAGLGIGAYLVSGGASEVQAGPESAAPVTSSTAIEVNAAPSAPESGAVTPVVKDPEAPVSLAQESARSAATLASPATGTPTKTKSPASRPMPQASKTEVIAAPPPPPPPAAVEPAPPPPPPAPVAAPPKKPTSLFDDRK